MKQTAVEWLFGQIKKDIIGLEYDYADELEQAKEMQKVQIIKAYQQGVTDEHGDTIIFTTEGEEYYNTLFKS